MGFGRNPNIVAGISPKAGRYQGRYTDAAAALSLTDSISNFLTDTLMDGTDDGGDCGATWNAASDRFEFNEPGVFMVLATALLDSSPETTGQGTLGFTIAGTIGGSHKTLPAAFRSEDVQLQISITRWFPAGSRVQSLDVIQTSGGALDCVYADFYVFRVA